MQRQPLTQRQQQIFDFVKYHIEETGMPPTRVEIAREIGFKSPNAAEEHLKALARKGYIEILSGTSRGIRLLVDEKEQESEEIGLPLIGKVAAGEPILAIENIENHYPVNGEMFSPSADYLLKVNGNSMENIGILDGDLLAVHKTNTVRNGQVVVARIDDEVTVKRLEKKGNILYLHPENDELETIVVDPSQQYIEIEGLAVGIIRNNSWM
ncbi:transcriptional repressor LexA [Pasteurella atlantica]|uniref:Transcriptional repressor LexA n=2 Tax=Pasteurellaceae TaxID=712 RepID=A0ACC6HMI7_9PAST|nr:transcriptional repressor LexA [Pasteurella atlantica]MDP8033549.1 transcriptional repressor LexA [Pasteurella atlantica]MDP8035484.1 transcriptional repressor LexA [Pasteurella atlantica]MDP8037435.1 transcriptional repressor LexA [Pasteurella atlantica]MDP8047784.1 transcriptional repressor LexA [Pasteurella atlantica]MDP8049655.1 transcriptional repressor LexA [Pasteurella atlantica]